MAPGRISSTLKRGKRSGPVSPFVVALRALIEGAVIVLPIGAIALLVNGIVHRLRAAADPLSGYYVHPLLVALAMLVLLCLLVGLLLRSATGRRARLLLERWVFERVPGYRLAKAFANEKLLDEGDKRALRPALAEIEEGQCPALVMDEFADGRLLVFVPGSPAPMSGTLYIFTPDRIVFLDVPLMAFMKTLSSWGLGLRELLEQDAAAKAAAPPRSLT